MLTEQEKRNVELIDTFVAAWNRRDTDGVIACLHESAQFTCGPIDELMPLTNPTPIYRTYIPATESIDMRVKPGTTRASGSMVTHERVDRMRMQDGSDHGSGTWFAIFAIMNNKIISFVDYRIGDAE